MADTIGSQGVVDFSDIRGSIKRALGSDTVGWIDIVTQCFEDIKAHCDRKQIDYPKVAQIKQKWGSLRIYFHEAHDDVYIRQACETAQRLADSSCECCGNAAFPQYVGAWVRTLCCWHAHRVARSRGIDFCHEPLNSRFHLLDHPLRCGSCGYIGQIAWGASGRRCPACVKRGI